LEVIIIIINSHYHYHYHHYHNKGSDSFGGPVTRFDIPLLWSSITKKYFWSDFNIPQVLIAKALGGCGALNAMVYIR